MLVVDAIKHYQRSIEKHKKDDSRLLHCIEKLSYLPVTVEHLKETDIGKTINGLKKRGGSVETSARTLVKKWYNLAAQSALDEQQFEIVRSHEAKNQEEEEQDDSDEREDDDDDEEEEVDVRSREKQDGKHGRIERRDKERRHREKEHAEQPEPRRKEKIEEQRETEKHSKHKDRKHETDRDRKSKHERSQKVEKNGREKENGREKKHDDKCDRKKEKVDKIKVESDSDESDLVITDKTKTNQTDKTNYVATKKQLISTTDANSYKPNTLKKPKDDDDDNAGFSFGDALQSMDWSGKKKKAKSDRKEREVEKVEKISQHERKVEHRSNGETSEKSETKRNDKMEKRVKDKDKEKKHEKRRKESLEKTEREVKIERNEEKTGHSSKRKHLNSERDETEQSMSFEQALTFGEPSSSTSKPSKSSKKSKKFDKLDDDVFYAPKRVQKTDSPEYNLDVPPQNDFKLSNIDLDVTLPTITPNYQPSRQVFVPDVAYLNSSTANEDHLAIIMNTKNQKTKVYSGNKTYGYVSSLFEMCIRILQENIDALAYTGGVPYTILLPVLERCTPEQLFQLEHHNAYLLEDTDPLWEKHCQRQFRNKQRMEMETWRDAYQRFLIEREERLQMLTANIKESINKSTPVRQTKLAYVDNVAKPPRNVARQQARAGSGAMARPVATPASRVASLSGLLDAAPPAPTRSLPDAPRGKPKKAPLMQKTLQLIKSASRYRR